MTMRHLTIALLSLVCMIPISCSLAPTHLEQQDLFLGGCGAMIEVMEGDASIWLLKDAEAVCERFEEKTGHPARTLLWEPSIALYYRRSVVGPCGSDGACIHHVPLSSRYDVYVTDDADHKRTLTRHEIAHLLLFQAGYPEGSHHALMQTWRLCFGHCGEYHFRPEHRYLP